ncbi:TIGR03084 family metal-binding protein [Actinomycetospora aeridis]|uniref:TIGR03084 family metal-binding protein n=1 Tax=Actinomycetospora aeridis TaxID=3129231 RepID=A0ABU8NA53_9PSEU
MSPQETQRSGARPGPSVDELLDDLDAERAAVMALVRELPRASWTLPTRAEPWTVRDQIAHLAWFDGAFARAVSTPAEFEAERDAITDVADFMDRTLREVPEVGPAALASWQDAARAFDRAARACDPSARLPWYGPSMSLRSAITSRMMETWAHGTDVADALDARLAPSERLRHVADLAVRARPQGYRVRGLPVSETPVLVTLTGPSGTAWTWAPGVSGVASQTSSVRNATQTNSVVGDAEEFCLVLARRRHVDDTALEVSGDAAREWMEIGQAFAGTPGKDPVRT